MSDELRRQLLSLVGELHPEDGVDPELLRRRERSGRRVKTRKLQALCREAQRVVQLSLPAELELELLSVSPDADPSRLILLFAPSHAGVDRQLAALRLESLQPHLRAEFARAIHRRRAPDLVLRLSPLPAQS